MPHLESKTQPATPQRRISLQFALSSLLVGMFVCGVFFATSGLWWRRVVEERQKSAVLIQDLEMAIQAEKQANRETQARLLVAKSQLEDAVNVQIGEQLAGREAAEREQQQLDQYAENLRKELNELRSQVIAYRREAEEARAAEVEAIRERDRAEQALEAARAEAITVE